MDAEYKRRRPILAVRIMALAVRRWPLGFCGDRTVLALLSLALGIYGALTMQRAPAFARWLALMLGVGWMLIALDVLVSRWLWNKWGQALRFPHVSHAGTPS